MTEELKPCPWCAGTDIQVVPHRMSPTMEREGDLISVEVRHHCPPTNGQPSRAVIRIGRDYASACNAWNTRAESAEVERLRARVAELEAALAEAVEDIAAWGAYADSYFKEKWNLAGDLERYRKVLTKGQEES